MGVGQGGEHSVMFWWTLRTRKTLSTGISSASFLYLMLDLIPIPAPKLGQRFSFPSSPLLIKVSSCCVLSSVLTSFYCLSSFSLRLWLHMMKYGGCFWAELSQRLLLCSPSSTRKAFPGSSPVFPVSTWCVQTHLDEKTARGCKSLHICGKQQLHTQAGPH